MGDPLATTGSAYNRDRQGLVRIGLVYFVDGPKTADLPEPWETLHNWAPATKPMGLPIVERNTEKLDSGDWKLTLTFEGVPANSGMETLVELDHAGVEDPIETFDKYEELLKKYPVDSTGTDQQFQGWKRKMIDPFSGKVVKNPIYGVSHFLNDNAILRISFLNRKFDPNLLKKHLQN